MNIIKSLKENSFADNEISKESLLHEITNCKACLLHQTRNNAVPGTGPIPCKIMLIGEGPGEKEDSLGEPFVGRSGKLLSQMLTDNGIKREDIFITNIVKCRPPGNRDPQKEEKKACQNHLIKQILMVKPSILVLVGSPSMKFVLDNKLTITKSRGEWLYEQVRYMDQPLAIMPLFHPSYLLRFSSKEAGKPRWLTAGDIQEIKKKRDEKIDDHY